jgi:hypothetical protein
MRGRALVVDAGALDEGPTTLFAGMTGVTTRTRAVAADALARAT